MLSLLLVLEVDNGQWKVRTQSERRKKMKGGWGRIWKTKRKKRKERKETIKKETKKKERKYRRKERKNCLKK